jgi:hypothetical protein
MMVIPSLGGEHTTLLLERRLLHAWICSALLSIAVDVRDSVRECRRIGAALRPGGFVPWSWVQWSRDMPRARMP